MLRLQLRRHATRKKGSRSSKAAFSSACWRSSTRCRPSLADRVFDVIGEVLSLNDVNLPEMLREAAVDPRRLDDYLDQIDGIDPLASASSTSRPPASPWPRERGFLRFPEAECRSRRTPADAQVRRGAVHRGRQASRPASRSRAPMACGAIEHVLADLRSERLASVQKLGKPEPNTARSPSTRTTWNRTSTSTPCWSGPAIRSTPPSTSGSMRCCPTWLGRSACSTTPAQTIRTGFISLILPSVGKAPRAKRTRYMGS